MKSILFLLGFFLGLPIAFSQVIVTDLRCEGLENPLSLGTSQPRFSWKLESNHRGIVQNSYEILVASDSAKLSANRADVWQSGKVQSAESVFVPYAGSDLKSRNRYFWKVRVWTNKGSSEWSNIGCFSPGLLQYKDWQGRWIGFDRYFPGDDEKNAQLSARYFRKEFSANKEVRSAMAYIIGLGLYELYIDGKKVGDQVLAPAPTDYTQNIKYNVFDVSHLLKKGPHALGVILGNGRFFAMRQAKPYKVKTFGFPKLLMQLEITYTDGSKTVIKTDNSWKGSADGPILANNEYDGEEYDARKEFGAWSNTGFNDKTWLNAEYVQEPGGTYEPQQNEFMKVMKELFPVSITKRPNGNFIVDFGQNLAGWIKLRVKGEEGRKVTIRYAESLQENGDLFTVNLRDARSTDHYILKGKVEEEWEPRFVYHGFRYVELSGYPGTPEKSDLTAHLVYDAMKNAGTFASSNALLNQLHHNAWWGIASNYKGIPVDCPQRNERQPWLGDRPVSCFGESFLFDNRALYTKWLDDIQYSQKADGAIPDVAPAFWRYYSDNISWPGTFIFVADMIHQQDGDVSVIKEHYPAMKKWLFYMAGRYLEDGIMTKDSYGDWCAPPPSIEEGRGVIADQKHPSALISTAYYYYLLNKMIDFARLCDSESDIAAYERMAEASRDAFNKKFYQPDGYYGENTLTDNLLGYYLGLVVPENQKKIEKQIVSIIEDRNRMHLSTGVIGTQWLMRSLTKMGRADLAYKLATQTSYPSWGYMLKNGATTIWELWNGNTAHPKMNSQNHVMLLGDLLIWYYENLAGIKSDEVQTGFKKIIMKPEMIPGLDWVEADHDTPYGTIRSSWRKMKNKFSWKISIPPNSTAIVYIPANSEAKVEEGNRRAAGVEGLRFIKMENGRAIFELGSGNYSFNSTVN